MENENKEVVYAHSNYSKGFKMAFPTSIIQEVVRKIDVQLNRDRNGNHQIGLSGYASAGEIIEIGEQRLQYRIVRQGQRVKGKATYIVRRTDCEDITTVDFLNAEIGAKVFFMDRKSGQELLEIFNKIHDHEL